MRGIQMGVMLDPDNFADPLKFLPDRFLKDGVYHYDPKVCNFSIGLRQCPGLVLFS